MEAVQAMGFDDPKDALAFDISYALQRSGKLTRCGRQEELHRDVARQILAHLQFRGWQIGRKELQLDGYRRSTNEARAALRMIREAVELHAPAGSLMAEERVEPPLVAEAEVLVNGILRIAEGA